MKGIIELMKLIIAYKNAYDQTNKLVQLILRVVEASEVLEVAGLEELDIVFLD